MSDTVSILDGNVFAVSDRRGDMEGGTGDDRGLFRSDTRFLSRWVLTVDGLRPNVLSIDEVRYFCTQFFMTLSTGTIYVNSHVSVIRKRAISNGFTEEITIMNHGTEPADFEVKLEAGADFADLFEVKDKLEKKGELYRKAEAERLVLGYRRDRFARETWITSTQPGQITEGGFTFKLHLPAHGSWSTTFTVATVGNPRTVSATTKSAAAKGDRSDELEKDVGEWVAAAPRLTTTWEPLWQTYSRSLVDLAALRFRSPLIPDHAMPAAGLPWFMAMFGRDSLLTSFQALPFTPELARTSLKVLGALQARSDDAFRDAEPGKILHELRLGELTAFEERPHSPYYGAADSTPLFLILLDEYERWSGDRQLVEQFQREARAAIRWIDEYGDKDKDGYVEYERRKPTGLVNQCWKDSDDSICFADGRIAELPRATCEIQGYVYDAKVRTARLARQIWNDPKWADELERSAAELKRRFNRDFWIEERGFYALALDGKKRKVDALTSNIGHLLWSGIVDKDKAERCAEHLMSDALFSGWGVRTLATTEASYNPIGYHVGAVWPHDVSFIAWGLRRYGYKAAAAKLARATFEAAAFFRYRLPEAFAGYDREASRFPVEYPTACSPQAWSSGAPLLLVRTMLGLDVEGEHLLIDPAVPTPIERIELLDIPGRWGRADAFGRARIDLAA